MVVGNPVNDPGGTTITVSESCGPTSVLVGGGYNTTPSNVQIVDTYGSFPSATGLGGTWTIVIGNNNTLGGGIEVTPYALCSP